MKYLWAFLGFIIIVSAVVFVLYRPASMPKTAAQTENQYKTTVLTMGGEQFTAQIADTPALQQLGLSYRTSIGQNDAMLFIFSQPAVNQFWMKGMNFPLDIIWLNSDKQIIYIEKNLSPATYPQAFGPTQPSQYVIEVASGTTQRLNLSVDQTVSFTL